MSTQQQILNELKTLNSNIATKDDMQDLRADIQTTIHTTSVNKPLQNYPSIQAIEHTPEYSKAIKGAKIGGSFMIAGVVIAAGLSNGLSALNLIPEYTYGIYGGLIAFGIAMTVSGLAYAIYRGHKVPHDNNPNLVTNKTFSSNSDLFKNDHYYSPAYSHLAGNVYHYH
ncbi:MAG: hypothetical protein Rsou_0363 [Candidatus Ruthia sp. Asou_11_S2]|nr:hypothetical protein [Candidatus Ruthia sp. Asou_11_S2]